MNDDRPILLMAQIDDAPGELLGYVMDEMHSMGAKNVQLLSSLGKKGRPGYVLLVDIDADDEQDFAGLLVGELGIWGYRVLETRHKHFQIVRHHTSLRLITGREIRTFPLRLKRILHDGEFIRAKAEYDDLVAIVEEFRSNRTVHLAALKAAVETAVGSDEPGDVVSVVLTSPASNELEGR